MGMTPEQYFELFVEGNASDSRDHPECVRRAFNAAVAASQLADHNFEYGKRHNDDFIDRFGRVGQYVNHLSEQTNGAFRDVRSIATVYKHLYSDTNARKDVHSS